MSSNNEAVGPNGPHDECETDDGHITGGAYRPFARERSEPRPPKGGSGVPAQSPSAPGPHSGSE
jgi:hypothetical protein